MRDMIGLGIVGNFANHLEQAGEAADFAHITTQDSLQPKGIFSFYVPNARDLLGRYCFNNERIILPNDRDLCVQAEAELALECELIYDDSHAIAQITPQFFMAFNDASVRNDKNATKLSQKKRTFPPLPRAMESQRFLSLVEDLHKVGFVNPTLSPLLSLQAMIQSPMVSQVLLTHIAIFMRNCFNG